MVVPSTISTPTLVRGSKQNSFSTTYTISFMQPQAINQASAIVLMIFPSDFNIVTAPICSSGTTNLVCSTIGTNRLTIQFVPVQTANNLYNFTLSTIINPFSFRPTSSITLATYTSDLLYQYSALSVGL